MKNKVDAIFWFRRDLRLDDNVGLRAALDNHQQVLAVFIFDSEILKRLQDADDARVTFIYNQLTQLKQELQKQGSDLLVVYGQVQEQWEQIISQYQPQAIYANRDFEPYARYRDPLVKKLASQHNCEFKTYVDHVIFEPGTILKDDGNPYSIYTPFSKKWLLQFEQTDVDILSTDYGNLAQLSVGSILTLESMGFVANTNIVIPNISHSDSLIKNYAQTRDLPYLDDGTSRLGIHLRFGTISIRRLVIQAVASTDITFLKELIWREFFMHLLWYYPDTPTQAFKEQYDNIPWRTGDEADRDFKSWQEGKTGYPIVDAGMRELNSTGHMHNRVRMITASFLCKHLLIDWRRGERYFAQKLLDYESASNAGNWQWASGSGADAAPYFRIFNPYTQREKFDPNWEYVNRWVPEYDTDDYPAEIVDYKQGRERALEVYKQALK